MGSLCDLRVAGSVSYSTLFAAVDGRQELSDSNRTNNVARMASSDVAAAPNAVASK